MRKIILGISIIFLFNCNKNEVIDPGSNSNFGNERKVVIMGYSDDAMEPFISKDGTFLFFNNLEGPNSKDIYFAEKVNDSTFQFKGEVQGVNGAFVDGNPTMDANGKFYFISTREYSPSDSVTIYSGNFNNGTVTDLQKVSGTINIPTPSWLNMGVEITADGKSMYTSYAFFNTQNNFPSKSNIRMARLENGSFNIPDNEDVVFSNINSAGSLEYAGEVSENELEMVYSRLTLSPTPVFKMFYTKRRSKSDAFDPPISISEPFRDDVNAFVEAPTFSSNGKIIYYHKRENGVISIFMLSRD